MHGPAYFDQEGTKPSQETHSGTWPANTDRNASK